MKWIALYFKSCVCLSAADGHCKKGQLLLQLSRPWDAKDAFRAAIELDKNSKEAAAGYQRCLTVLDQDVHQARVRISQQPGVQRCLQDHRMKEALKLMQEDPMQARRLMRDSVEDGSSIIHSH
ncbi:stress-induced-phosphoprotein 1-like isoform X2 [Amphibalanus amphitrite]|uniref:stress-induced-phosphoprotein 1-like isoform X2 n=1 Tax=Amphibalanus amphitrite TaxID=1232801 RepID=UPI001C917BCE|nr:stress-induced-phosphoprotein 1-like isoform X2 [Amphibalanus amphitrite]